MTTKAKKVALYTLAGALISFLTIAAVYFLAIGATTVWHKRQLANGSLRIIATVTEVDDSFHFVRGGEGAHSISYTFTYRDSTGKTQKATRSDFELANGDDKKYEVGSQIVISYLVSNPDINEPTHYVGRVSASFVFMARVISGLVGVAITYSALRRWFPQPLRYGQGIVRLLIISTGIIVAFSIGSLVGGYLVYGIEQVFL